MTAALSVADFTLRSIMPAEDTARLDAQYPGFLAAAIATAQSWVDARLRKRYAIPFVSPGPEIYLGWIVSLVTVSAYQRRGWNPSGAENELIMKAADTARAEVKEAGDSKEGLFELPMREDTPIVGAVTAGGPMAYSETSPYRWTDLQREDAED